MSKWSNRMLLIAALLACGRAGAEPAMPECEAPEAVRGRIDACSANSKAVESARQCYQQVVQAWQEAPRELNRIMSVATKRSSSRQQAELAFSKTDYEKTIARLRKLLHATEESTRRVAEYPLAMLHDPDFPELNCYADAFREVQEIVYQLDDRIEEGERTLAAAEDLHGVSGQRERYVGTDSPNALGGNRQAGVGSGRSRNSVSDVTGLEEDRRKRSGATRSSRNEALEVFSRVDPSLRDFAAEISRQKAAGVAASNEEAQREAASVGAFLFREDTEARNGLQLELSAGGR